uniref:Terminase large subunit n=1 Tax=Podoviridae sp. ctUT63 TaxID=2825253 RepID=A0A8S5Q7A7_9CAUD|nr:MAG TPA: Terminase large subunit [Podoviridae sp. ctUT63]
MSLSTSPEFYVNMKKPPVWNDLFGWEDQDDDVKQFFKEEAYKVKYGVTINGTFIPPWLYWHVNFFPVFQDLPNGERVPAISRLRDNEWFFAEMYQRARQEKKGLGMFGTRRFGKALLDSELIYTPYGSNKIGFADIGDIIYGDDGNLTTIVGVYPQGFVDTYKVTFEDGRSVVCCGQHQWKVKYHGDYKVMSTMGIIHSDFSKMTIDMGDAVDFPERRWLISPQLMGSLVASFLCGATDRIFELSKKEMDDVIYSSKKQKELFINSFMKIACGISTGDDRFKVVCKSEYIISFVRRIFWSMGYYCVMDGDDMYISKTHNRLRISDIDYYGKYKATCIEVDNKSHQFLTTNFVVSHNTTIMSSLLQMNATMTIGLSHSVVGFSDSDLSNIGEYCEYGLDHVHPFFRINRTKTDWSSGVTLGKRMSNGVRDIHAIISIANINMGRKTSTQKTAGLTPATAIFDEVGKGPIKKPYTAAMPSYDTPYGWRLSPILAGTGGEVELSKDAQEMFSDPETYNLLVMDWDILNRRAMKGKTWKERKWAMFVPGQMANSGVKRTIGLGDYLGKPDDKKLNKIKIDATDFEASTNKLNEERKKLSTKDRVAYTSHTMFYPFTIDDCFLSSSQNLFPVEYAIKHKNDLLESGQYSGMLCDVFLESGNKLGTTKSNKQLAGFPFSGGVIDAPVQIFEMPQSNRFDDFIYVAGQDPYKQVKSDTPSLGSFYIFKRRVGIRDPYAYRIVASYVSRPSSIDQFCRTCEVLQKGYGAICLMENADQMYEQYLNRKSGMPASFFLFAGEAIANKYVKAGSRQNSKLGLYPTPGNQNLLFSCVVDYCWQDFVIGYDDQIGLDITVKGIELIDDIALLDEIIQYKPGLNVDRIIAFGHALVLARYFDDNNYMPKSKIVEMNNARKEDAYKHHEIYASAFGSVSIGAFR